MTACTLGWAYQSLYFLWTFMARQTAYPCMRTSSKSRTWPNQNSASRYTGLTVAYFPRHRSGPGMSRTEGPCPLQLLEVESLQVCNGSASVSSIGCSWSLIHRTLNQTSPHATVSCSSTPLSKANIQVWSENTALVDFARAIDTPKPSAPPAPFSSIRHATIAFLLQILPCWLPFIFIVIIIIDRLLIVLNSRADALRRACFSACWVFFSVSLSTVSTRTTGSLTCGCVLLASFWRYYLLVFRSASS